jgi:hypothetical protein
MCIGEILDMCDQLEIHVEKEIFPTGFDRQQVGMPISLEDSGTVSLSEDNLSCHIIANKTIGPIDTHLKGIVGIFWIISTKEDASSLS